MAGYLHLDSLDGLTLRKLHWMYSGKEDNDVLLGIARFFIDLEEEGVGLVDAMSTVVNDEASAKDIFSEVAGGFG